MMSSGAFFLDIRDQKLGMRGTRAEVLGRHQLPV